MSEHTEAQWNAAISAALRANDVEAVPGLLALMALDGYGHEAESLRRLMLLDPAALAATPTHDGAAAHQEDHDD